MNYAKTLSTKHGLEFSFCTGICSDGEAAMVGNYSGAVFPIRELTGECTPTLCFLHQESLASKGMSAELHNRLNDMVKIMNL